MNVHDLVTILSVLLAAALTALGFSIKSQISNNRSTNATLAEIARQLAVLNTGASQGAREGIAQVNRRVDSVESKLDELEERHNSLALSEGIVADRINGHIRTPHMNAHPHSA